jgi:hypothetical protein
VSYYSVASNQYVSQLFTGLIERCTASGVAPPVVVDTLTVYAGITNTYTVTNGYTVTNNWICYTNLTVTNQFLPFAYTWATTNSSGTATAYPPIRASWFAAWDAKYDAVLAYANWVRMEDCGLLSNDTADAYFADGTKTDLPTGWTKTNLFTRYGIGIVTNGTAYFTHKPATYSNEWKLGSVGFDCSSGVGRYDLEDNASNTVVVDSWGTNNASTARNTSLLTTAGKIGNGLEMNATNTAKDYIETPDIIVAGCDYSVSFWMKTEPITTGVHKYALDGGAKDQIGFSIWFAPFVVFYSLYGTSTFWWWSPGPDSWNHYVIVSSGTAKKLYVNDTLIATRSASSQVSKFVFGADGTKTSGVLNATFDSIQIYSRAISAAEVTTLYNGGAGTVSRVGESFKRMTPLTNSVYDASIRPVFEYSGAGTSTDTVSFVISGTKLNVSAQTTSAATENVTVTDLLDKPLTNLWYDVTGITISGATPNIDSAWSVVYKQPFPVYGGGVYRLYACDINERMAALDPLICTRLSMVNGTIATNMSFVGRGVYPTGPSFWREPQWTNTYTMADTNYPDSYLNYNMVGTYGKGNVVYFTDGVAYRFNVVQSNFYWTIPSGLTNKPMRAAGYIRLRAIGGPGGQGGSSLDESDQTTNSHLVFSTFGTYTNMRYNIYSSIASGVVTGGNAQGAWQFGTTNNVATWCAFPGSTENGWPLAESLGYQWNGQKWVTLIHTNWMTKW